MTHLVPDRSLQPNAGAPSAPGGSTLGLPAENFLKRLAPGARVGATVLTPQNGQDALLILGRRVVSALPPTVRPGDMLLLEVLAHDGDQIQMRNVDTIPAPGEPAPRGNTATAPVSPQSAAPASVSVASANPAQSPPPTAPKASVPASTPVRIPPPDAATATPSTTAVRPSSSVAPPPRSVFVPATVVPVNAQRLQIERQASVPPRVPERMSEIEVRLAANRATDIPATRPTATAHASVPPTRAAIAARSAIAGDTPKPILNSPSRSATVAAGPRAVPAPPDVATRLRVAKTAVVQEAANLVHDATGRLPQTFARLERALAAFANDARAATLRTVAAFLGRPALEREDVLSAQLSAFVDALGGVEEKTVDLLRAKGAAQPSPPEVTRTSDAPVSTSTPRAGSIADPIAAAAHAVEREAALERDPKALLLSLMERPPQNATPELHAAVRETLVGLTAAQLQTLDVNARANGPSFTMALPVTMYEGGRPVELRVSRNADGRHRQAADAENFHVAFVLDTQSFGTIAIDVQAVSRTVSVAVKTARERDAQLFRGTIRALTSRLERLRYRVARTSADVAPRVSLKAPASPTATSETRSRLVDSRA